MSNTITIERLARALCRREGHANPDLVVAGGPAYAIANRGLYITPRGAAGPLWQLWSGLAADLVNGAGQAAAEEYAAAVESGDPKAIAGTKLATLARDVFAKELSA